MVWLSRIISLSKPLKVFVVVKTYQKLFFSLPPPEDTGYVEDDRCHSNTTNFSIKKRLAAPCGPHTMDPGATTEAHRGHKKTKAGRGAREKKRDKKAKKEGTRNEKHNSRAFSVANIGRTQKTIQRNLDRGHKKEFTPAKDRRADERPPPVLVAVMGPPGVGKSTLIRSLVKMYTNHNLTSVTGPITVVTGKQRRVTFFECPNDAASMLDCAKIADLVLLCVDAKFGFEMETFEFLNILQVHGFPKVFGIFTHLDQFRTTKNLQKTKKLLKHRFWTEIYDGAKMFYFSGCINGKYLKNEIKQLTLLISRVKVCFN